MVLATTNNDPIFVSNIYLNCIKQYNIVPKFLRIDGGTENVYCQNLPVHFTSEEKNNNYSGGSSSIIVIVVVVIIIIIIIGKRSVRQARWFN